VVEVVGESAGEPGLGLTGAGGVAAGDEFVVLLEEGSDAGLVDPAEELGIGEVEGFGELDGVTAVAGDGGEEGFFLGGEGS
jgi:hypothetical protein